MSPEVMSKQSQTDAELAAEKVLGYMMQDMAQPQLKLFEDETPVPYSVLVDDLQEKNPDKIVLSGNIIAQYRYIAAFLGAGFHMSQYDEITYKQNEDAGKPAFRIGLTSAKIIPERSLRANRMQDEIDEEPLYRHVPSTKYDLSSRHYITSEEDLKAIFEFDYNNLKACKELNFDLLYEREC